MYLGTSILAASFMEWREYVTMAELLILHPIFLCFSGCFQLHPSVSAVTLEISSRIYTLKTIESINLSESYNQSTYLLHAFFCNTQVALKALVVVHRLLREGDPTFREELLNFSQRGRILQLSNFKDDSSPVG
jgi:hypothetical protein